MTTLELFFDLVFVFAITQLSHFLIAHFTPLGALQTLVLLLAVWWVWVFTAWVTNWLNPIHLPVRLMMIGLMLVGLVLSSSLTDAFAERGLAFAVCYVTMQVGRSAFALWSMWNDSIQQRNFTRITVWLSVSALFWCAGGLSDGSLRLGLWLLAVLWEYAGPAAGFALPGLGRSTTRDWSVSGEHMAERAGLFVLIALGENLLIAGSTFAKLPWTVTNLLALTATFAMSVALWWTYFVVNAGVVAATIRTSSDPGRLARFAYTYLHVPIVAGLVLAAAGGELVLAHPDSPLELSGIVAVVGGPGLFLLGNLLFKRAVKVHFPLSHGLGLLSLLGLGLLGRHMPALLVNALVVSILVTVAIYERGRGAVLRSKD